MKLILIGNYPADKQESMERFAQMLAKGFSQMEIRVDIWRPRVLFGRLQRTTNSGIGKWLGYVDKWILFSLTIQLKLIFKYKSFRQVHFHVCDHSNSPYLKFLPKMRTAITCHDVLAIRGALGYSDAYCSASFFGRILQQWILDNLFKARNIACVSNFTSKQFQQLSVEKFIKIPNLMVIYNALNDEFEILPDEVKYDLLHDTGLSSKTSFILNVGSGLPRKNRSLLLHMLRELDSTWDGYVCYAGERLDEALIEEIESLGLKDRVISVIKPTHEVLKALYNCCSAFVFPSFSEGFGWPLIEAQACGAPVIASNIEPMPEITGGAAIFADPTKPDTFANAFKTLEAEKIRTDLILRGRENSLRFSKIKMINDYIKLHNLKGHTAN